MRRSRESAVAGLLALTLALLAVCPCGPMMLSAMGAGPEGGAHDCCAPAEGISANVTDCCADDGRPSNTAAADATPPSVAAPGPGDLVAPAPQFVLVTAAQVAAPFVSPPRLSILRI